MTTAIKHSKSQLTAQYPFVQTSLLGGAPAANGGLTNNPNPWVAIFDRRARIVPLGGAATFPVLVEAEGGSARMVFDTSPVDFDGDRIRCVPQTMAQAFGRGAVSDSGGFVDAGVTNALYPQPTSVASTSFVAGSVTRSAGYIGGLFAVESGASLGSAPGLTPPFTWCAAAGMRVLTADPSSTTPIKLPEYIRRGTDNSTGIGAIPCIFLGCGAGVIRHDFATAGTAWVDAHVVYKWYLDPFSTKWMPGGSLNIGPNVKGGVAIIEESIDLQLPTWLFLELDAADSSGQGVFVTSTITRGGR